MDQLNYIVKKGNVYKYFQFITEDRDLDDDYMDSFPAIFHSFHFELAASDSLNRSVCTILPSFKRECNRFNKFYNVSCDLDTFILLRSNERPFRTFNGTVMIIPILNRINIHPITYNIYEYYDKKNKIFYLKAKRDIKKGEAIVLKSLYDTNLDNLIHFGIATNTSLIFEAFPGQRKKKAINYVCELLDYNVQNIIIKSNFSVKDLFIKIAIKSNDNFSLLFFSS